MTGWTLAVVFVVATSSLVGGLVVAVARWLRAPSHPRFALTPAPGTRTGVVLRLAREGLLFESLWRADRVAWVLGWSMHAALAVIAFGHLRYLTPSSHPLIEAAAALGPVATPVLIVALAGLWLRRVLVERLRWSSRVSDHAWLALLLLIAGTGAALKYLEPGGMGAVWAWTRGLLALEPVALAPTPVLIAHLLGAAALFAIFPFSKLLHGVAVWVNPTRASRGVIDGGSGEL